MMNPQTSASANASPLVMWIIWFAIVQGIFILYFFAAPKPAADAETVVFALSPISLIALGAAGAGMVLRWVVIPRLGSILTQFPIMIVGLALCEACGILGMFAVPSNHTDERLLLVGVALATLILSAPVYTLRRKAASPFHAS